VGVAGEICIAGNSLASGYLNSPELTRERFIDFAPYGLPERRIYRTGDLGRYLPDGNLEFLGRIDRQVKLRGLRLELSEIEALLRQCAGVQDAIALVREDTPGDQRLVAYVTGKNQTVLDPSTLMDQIRRQLPLGMVPGVIVPLKQFPRTVTGKLDEKALPEPEYPEVEEKGLPPETLTATEERLRRIWAEVLGRENFGKQDNLFFLGGHSIHAIRIIARIRDEFGFSLPLQALFQEPSISATAAHIDRQAASSQDSH
ncbi:MAG: AMP-binding protein, partial [Verrucomicrobiae bacterium]|nr:AMP-binding protein [Verrucomicrobiae bacterium]